MKKPYIKKLKEANDLTIWLVDGYYIRKYLEKDFTNCSDSFRFKLIPKFEAWIDKDNSKFEIKCFIKFYETKYYHLSKNVNYKKAVMLAEIEEKKLRLSHKKAKYLINKTKEFLYKKIYKKKLHNYSNNKLNTYLVDGFLVRTFLFLDFTHGGHDLIYSFIPKNEIWIDDSISKKDFKPVLLHELYERNLMKKGWKYDLTDKRKYVIQVNKKQKINKSAHESALLIENYYRNNPSGIDDAIKKELYLKI